MATRVGVATVNGAALTFTATLPTGWAAGDLVLLFVWGKYRTAAANTPAGWTPVTGRIQHSITTTGNDIGNCFAYVFARIMQAGDTAPSISASATVNCWGSITVAYRPDAGKTFTDAAALGSMPWVSFDDAINNVGSNPGLISGSATFATQPAAAQGATLAGFFSTPTDSGGSQSGSTVTNSGLSGGTNADLARIETSTGGDASGLASDYQGFTGTATGATSWQTINDATTTTDVGIGVLVWLREAGAAGITYDATATGQAVTGGAAAASIVKPGSASGTATTGGAAAVTLNAAAAATGQALTGGTASPTASYQPTAAGTATTGGAAAVTAILRAAASGAATTSGAAAVTAAAAATAAGTATSGGTAAVTATLQAAATGQALTGGAAAATLAGPGPQDLPGTASGTAVTGGAAAVTLQAQATATGQAVTGGAAAAAAQLQTTASGTATTGWVAAVTGTLAAAAHGTASTSGAAAAAGLLAAAAHGTVGTGGAAQATLGALVGPPSVGPGRTSGVTRGGSTTPTLGGRTATLSAPGKTGGAL